MRKKRLKRYAASFHRPSSSPLVVDNNSKVIKHLSSPMNGD